MDQNQNPYENPLNQNFNPQNNPNPYNANPYHNAPYNGNPYGQPAYIYTKPNYMETAALVLGILSVVTCCCRFGGSIFGALAIVFALLSRGGKMKMGTKAKFAFWLGISGIVITTIYYGYSLYLMFSDGTFEAILRETCELYGLDYETLYGDMFR